MKRLSVLCLFLSCYLGGIKANGLLPFNTICTDSITIIGNVIDYEKSPVGLTFGVHMNGFIQDTEATATQVDEKGHFSLRIPLTFRLQVVDFGLIGNDITPCVGYVMAKKQSVVQIDFVYENKQFKPRIQGDSIFSDSDQENVSSVLGNIDLHFVKVNAEQFKLSTDTFLKLQLDSLLPHSLKEILSKYKFSEKGKCYMETTLRFFYICHSVLKYGKGANLYLKEKREPPISYYAFLKGWNLNSSVWLYDFCFDETMSTLLNIAAFHIPDIGETPVAEWIKVVAQNIHEAVGFSSGPFYERLAIASYARQFEEYNTHLTPKQLANIENYFCGEKKDVVTLLRRYDRQVVVLKEKKETAARQTEEQKQLTDLPAVKLQGRNSQVHIHTLNGVKYKQLIPIILRKYPGNTVVIDFWATWCGPCMMAHKLMRSLRNKLVDKPVVFVYIAQMEEDKNNLEKEAKEIKGEQYFITTEQMAYLQKAYGFNGIPAYFIFNSKQQLKYHSVGFPGNDVMEREILK